MSKSALFAFLIVFVLPAHGAEVLVLQQGAVRFLPAADWREIQRVDNPARSVALYQIPNPADEGTEDSANAVVAVSRSEGPLKEFASEWIQRRTSTGAILLERFESGEPTTDVFAFYRWQQGRTPYVAADRFARRGNLVVHVSVAWPILETSTEEWSRKMLSEANRVLSSLVVHGASLGVIARLRSAVVVRGSERVSLIEAVHPQK